MRIHEGLHSGLAAYNKVKLTRCPEALGTFLGGCRYGQFIGTDGLQKRNQYPWALLMLCVTLALLTIVLGIPMVSIIVVISPGVIDIV